MFLAFLFQLIMPIVLSEAAKKSILHHNISQKKAKDDEKASPSSDESEETMAQSSTNLQPIITGDKKKHTKPELPIFEDYLPNPDEELDTKVKWLVKKQLSKNIATNLAKKSAHLDTSSSDLDSSSASDEDSSADSSDKPLPAKKMKKQKEKKKTPLPKKKVTKPKKSKKVDAHLPNHKELTKLFTLLAKKLKS